MAEHRPLTDHWAAELYVRDGWQVIELSPAGETAGEPTGLAESLWQVAHDWRPPRLVLDLRRVDFLSSSLMGVLVRLHKRVAASGGAFHVCCLSPLCTEALHACRLHTVIPVFDSVETAAGYGS